jgi:hypothetical protein
MFHRESIVQTSRGLKINPEEIFTRRGFSFEILKNTPREKNFIPRRKFNEEQIGRYLKYFSFSRLRILVNAYSHRTNSDYFNLYSRL